MAYVQGRGQNTKVDHTSPSVSHKDEPTKIPISRYEEPCLFLSNTQQLSICRSGTPNLRCRDDIMP